MNRPLLICLCFGWFSLASAASVNFGGRLEVDAATYREDATPLPGGVEWRRVRLDVSGRLTKRWSYYVQTDLKHARNDLQLAWVRYRFGRRNNVQLGRVEMPFSLESVSNSKYNLFMERALPMALTERYGIGAVYSHLGRNWNFRLGAFGDDHFRFGGQPDYGQALAGRWGMRHKWRKARAYAGFSFSVRDLDRDSENPLRFRARPETFVSPVRLIDTYYLAGAERLSRFGVEGLWKTSRWVVQGEWLTADVRRRDVPDVRFQGAYLQVGRTFNGQRRFSFRRGEWTAPKIRAGKTWELAARVSWLDLASADLNGGSQTNFTVGVNWYPLKNARLMFNWVHAITHPNRYGQHETPDVAQVRLQYEF